MTDLTEKIDAMIESLPKTNKELRGPKMVPQRRRSKSRRDRARVRRAAR